MSECRDCGRMFGSCDSECPSNKPEAPTERELAKAKDARQNMLDNWNAALEQNLKLQDALDAKERELAEAITARDTVNMQSRKHFAEVERLRKLHIKERTRSAALVAALELAIELEEHGSVSYNKYGLTEDKDILAKYKSALAKYKGGE